VDVVAVDLALNLMALLAVLEVVVMVQTQELLLVVVVLAHLDKEITAAQEMIMLLEAEAGLVVQAATLQAQVEMAELVETEQHLPLQVLP
jgi:hypothetical protein